MSWILLFAPFPITYDGSTIHYVKEPLFRETVYGDSLMNDMDVDVKSVLPDFLKEGLKIVFVGTAASDTSARRGHYYAYPSNRFWSLLFETGLTDRLLTPDDDSLLVKYGYGLTDMVKTQHSGDDTRLPKHLLTSGVKPLEAKIRRFAPKIVCFTSMNAYKAYFKRRATSYGLQPTAETIGTSRIFVTPSPSPRVSATRSRDGKTRLQWFQELAKLTDSGCS